MQLKYFAAITCLTLGYVTSVQGAVDVVSLAVIVIAGVAILKEKIIAAEIHRNYIRQPVHDSGYGHKRGYGKTCFLVITTMAIPCVIL